MRKDRGFTLIEVVIAVAIASSLVAAVYTALASTSRTAERQMRHARRDARRIRAIEILRADFRGRVELETEGETIILKTTADGFSPYQAARSGLVTYSVQEEGLVRTEGEGDMAMEVLLTKEPVEFQFWEEGMWRKTLKEEALAVRVIFLEPLDVVVIR